MFIVLLNYRKPLVQVNELLEEHRKFLDRHYASGLFLLSGRKEPRTGGFILAAASGRQALIEILAADPFSLHGIANYEVIEVVASRAAPSLDFLLETNP
ncbi:YciI family protein [Castellaniella sp.]|uniref:YciI family protein n=1 Tax=Castellaniella sp. TaxID=1955812 RepID=UPI002AFEF854|nr:YciI family protein [Castellaniella sp.]